MLTVHLMFCSSDFLPITLHAPNRVNSTLGIITFIHLTIKGLSLFPKIL